MGLLNKVSASGISVPEKKPVAAAVETTVQKKSNSVGLLKKSLTVSKDDGLDFFEFIDKYNFNFFALLKEEDGIYCIDHCAGFDGISICHSVSTKDFWDGILNQKNKLFEFSLKDNSLQPFYQFFSGALKDKLSNIYAFMKDDESIVLFACDNMTADKAVLVQDLTSLTEHQYTKHHALPDLSQNNLYLYEIDFSEAIDSFILANAKPDAKDRLKAAIANQIYYNLLHNFPLPSRIVQNENAGFKAACCFTQDLPFELISNHIRFDNSYILQEHANLMTMNYCGKAETQDKLKDFLQAE